MSRIPNVSTDLLSSTQSFLNPFEDYLGISSDAKEDSALDKRTIPSHIHLNQNL